MSVLVGSFFTSGGVPATGLTPTIRIWEVTGGVYNLVIGTPAGTGSAVDGVMTEVTDIPNTPDGFYTYNFSTILGHSPTKEYLIRTNGGLVVPISERFQTTFFTPDSLDEPQTIHTIVGTVGANIAGLVIDVDSVIAMLELVLKFQANRTKIDTSAKTLTVYDDDCTTVLRVFELFDSLGSPSVTEVCERVPTAASDGLPVCP